MEKSNRAPIYNLSAVLRETGLKADLIRAWERRYKLPQPQRSSGGHRLYSAYDIDTLRWLKSRQGEGLSISNAVELWRSIIADGKDPLSAATSQKTSLAAVVRDSDNSINTLRKRWLDACEQFNSTGAEEVLNMAFSLYPVEAVCAGVLQKGLNEIGSGWHIDKITVQQEHFASSLANRRLDTLLSLAPYPSRQQTILIGCPQGEWHTFPLLLLELFLRRRGWKVVNLGADIPLDRMVTTTLSINPDLVVMAAQTLVSAASLSDVFSALLAAGKPLAYGGLIFNRVAALRESFPGFFLGEALEEGISVIEGLLRNPQVKPSPVVITDDNLDLIQRFQEKRIIMEMEVINQSVKAALPFEFVNEANAYFGNALIAALKLGNLNFVRTELEWIRDMLIARQLPSAKLIQYLRAYQDVLRRHLEEVAHSILALIELFIADFSRELR